MFVRLLVHFRQDLTMYSMLALNSQSSYLRLTSSVIMRQHRFFFSFSELGAGSRASLVLCKYLLTELYPQAF